MMFQAAAPTNQGPTSSAARIAALADQCVKCGLCQPVCPTYRIGRSEAESPRGRIAFAQALASGQLAATASLTAHLDHCLACMSCERVCPSQVRYGELIVATRSLLRQSRQPTWRERSLHALMRHSGLVRAVLAFANVSFMRRCLQSRTAQAILRPMGFDRAAREMPRVTHAGPRPQLAPVAGSRGRVGLFLGCVAAVVERDVCVGATHLLQALGYEVVVPPGQGCCGAMARHAGDIEGADTAATPTQQAFVDAGVDTVLVSASGCYGTLRDHTFADAPIRVREIHDFLANDERIDDLEFRPLASRVAVHTPCTQANVARASDAILALMTKIPQMEIAAMPAEPRCCGAAGDYFLRHAAIADTLRAETLDQVAALAPALLLTSNIGCRIFLANGLRQRDRAVPVIHPVVLLAQQLQN